MHRGIARGAALDLLVAALCVAALAAAWIGLAGARPVPLGSYCTSLVPRTPAQLANIMRAARAVDGTRVAPGQLFSFNARVGNCSPGNGYVPAPTLINGELKPASGGGVCQLSSTLYNAALLAGLPIVERHAHSRPASSVPVGLDATVFSPDLDLRFRNNTSSELVVRASAAGGMLVCQVVGRRGPGWRATVRTETTPVRDAGGPAIRVRTWRTTTAPGGVATEELMSDDVYHP